MMQPTPSNSKQPVVRPKPPSLEATRILVADDDNTSRRLLVALLRLRGAQVEIAENGRQAIASAANGGYDLIFMDRHMPDIDGLEATRSIRLLGGGLALLPIIGLTAYDDVLRKNQFMEAGLNSCLTKPIRQAELWTTLRRWLIRIDSRATPPTVDNEPDCPVAKYPDSISDSQSLLQRDLIATMIADLSERYSGLIEALDDENYEAIASQAHAIAGSAATCGLDHLREAAMRLEGGAQETNRSAVVAQMRKLFGAIDNIVGTHRATA